MKKLFVLLLAFAMVGMVFAEDAKPTVQFSGSVYGAAVGHMDEHQNMVLLWNRNYGWTYDDAFRSRINATFTDGNYGAKIRLQSSDLNLTESTQALVWMKFFDGLLKTKVGKLDDYSYSTWYNYFGNFDGKTGVLVQLAPVDGLSIGAFVPVYGIGNQKNTNKVVITDQTVQNTFKGPTAFAASYTIKDVANIVAGYQLGSVDFVKDRASFWFGADVKAIENLTARVEANLTALGDSTNQKTYIWERVGYKMDALYVQLDADQTLFAKSGAAFGFGVYPCVEYTMGDATFGGSFGYFAANNEGTLDSTTKPLSIYTKAVNGFSVNPYVTLALGAHELSIGGIYEDDDMGADGSSWVRAYAMYTINF